MFLHVLLKCCLLNQCELIKPKSECDSNTARTDWFQFENESFEFNGSIDSLKDSIQMTDSFTSLNLWHLGERYNSESRTMPQCVPLHFRQLHSAKSHMIDRF